MYDHALFEACKITRSDVGPHVKWVISLVIAYGHFNLPYGFEWACKVNIILFPPKGLDEKRSLNNIQPGKKV